VREGTVVLQRSRSSEASGIHRLLRRIDRSADRVLRTADGRWTLASTIVTGSIVATVTWMALSATPSSSRLYEPGNEQVAVPNNLFSMLADAASPSSATAAQTPYRTAGLTGAPVFGGPVQRLFGAAGAAASNVETRTLRINNGETIIEVLQDAGVARDDANAVVEALRPHYSPRNIRSGQVFEATFGPDPASPEMHQIPYVLPASADSDDRRLLSLSFSPSIENQITVKLTAPDGYMGEMTQRRFEERYQRAAARIDSSLYLAAMQAGIPAEVVVDLIRMFSYDVDFQRDVQPGDEFEVAFNRFYTEDGRPAKTGTILAASMTLSGRKQSLYRFDADSGDQEYFDADGRSARSMLMRTPVDGARISSRFGRRRHPILGYNRMHKGIDFAVPTGTPVMAAGSGMVTYADYQPGFGNLVVVTHTNGYATAYGHLSRVAQGVRRGVRVRQGQIVAYSGSTGMSTGPHLHYEVRLNGAQVNPSNMRMANGRTLSGDERRRFLAERGRIDTLVASLPVQDKLTQTVSLREAAIE
jgi:murein DD-endopeptidase MepM/ murein hydrolase activator NlpD